MATENTIVKQNEKESPVQAREEWLILPAADIYDDGSAFIFKLNMPGVTEEELDIEVKNDEIRVNGRQEPKFPENMQLIYEGWRTGTFSRTFSLPSDDIDIEKISAKIKDGVLTITVPKREEAKPRKIKVTVE